MADELQRGSAPVAIVAIDSKVEARTLRPILENQKFRILEASGIEVLDLAIKHSARLVVKTLDLSEKAGADFWQALLQHECREITSFLFVIPQETSLEKLIGREVVACDYVKRPINLVEFERRVSGVLRFQPSVRAKAASMQREPDSLNVVPEPQPVKRPSRRRPGRFRNTMLLQSSSTQAGTDEAPLEAASEGEETALSPPAGKAPEAAEVPEAPEIEPLSVPAAPDVKLPEAARHEAARGLDSAPPPAEQKVEAVAQPEAGEVEAQPEAGEAVVQPGAGEAVAAREVPAPVPLQELPADEGSRPATAPGLVSGAASTVYEEAATFVLASIRRAVEAEPVDAKKGVDIVRRLIRLLRHENGLLLLATDRLCEFSLARSSVNVAIIACHIGRTLGLSEERSLRVGLAGLLHDIGVVRLSRDFLHRARPFTDSERVTVGQIPLYSAEILSDLPREFDWLPALVRKLYRRENGEAPSQGMRERELSEEGYILGISVVFEACIHKRPNRNAMTGYRALEVLLKKSERFPDNITKGMLQAFSVYPFNEFVVLNTGEIGQVIDVHPENPMRPTVKLLYTVEGESFFDQKIVDLTQNSAIYVIRAITWQELPSA